MTRYGSTLLKRLPLSGGCVDIMRRQDGTFHFYHRVPCDGKSLSAIQFESAVYISAETAEAAARLKFKL